MHQENNNISRRKNKHLTKIERECIERWYNKEKCSKTEIARRLDRNEKTIRNEIKRGLVYVLDSLYREVPEYSAVKAENNYQYYLKGRGTQLKIGSNYELKEHIETRIKKYKESPEVIAYQLEKNGFKYICPKTIRNYIRAGDILDIKEKDMIYKKKFKSKNPNKHCCIKVPPEKSIDFRPKEIDKREEYGHWEGDLVVGARNKGSVIFTLTERKTREEILFKLKNKKTESVAQALDSLESRYKNKFYNKFKTITFDNGVEFRGYEGIEKSCMNEEKRTVIYYAHPYRSCERGSNENANKLIRRFIPKGTNINKISIKKIKEIENWINNYPRKIFGYRSTMDLLKEKNTDAVI